MASSESRVHMILTGVTDPSTVRNLGPKACSFFIEARVKNLWKQIFGAYEALVSNVGQKRDSICG